MDYGPIAILLFALLSSPLLIGALRRRMRGWRLAAVVLLMAYIVFAAKYFFFPIYFVGDGLRGAGLGLELIPVRPLVEQARHMGAAVFLRNVGGNILAFLPLTFLCAAAYPRFRRFGASAGLAVLCSLGVELTQLVINLLTHVPNRAVDINDVLLNTIGGMLGFACWKLAAAVYRSIKHT